MMEPLTTRIIWDAAGGFALLVAALAVFFLSCVLLYVLLENTRAGAIVGRGFDVLRSALRYAVGFTGLAFMAVAFGLLALSGRLRE